MIKNLMFFGLILSGIYYFGFRKTDLDMLMKPATNLAEDVPANIFVEPDYSHTLIHDTDYVEKGHYTIIYYHMATCPGCLRLDEDLKRFQEVRKDVAVRKIDTGTNWSLETARANYGRNIGATPFLIIFGPDGKQISSDENTTRIATYLMYDWLNAVMQKAEERGK